MRKALDIKMLLSVVVLTFNEEKNIARCLEQVQDLADELIIIDSGSTDRTVQIAEGMGAKVYVRALNGDFAAQRNFALEKAQSEYIFYLDADEFVTPELALVIQEFVRAGKKEVYSIKRRNIAFGEKVNHGVLAPDYVPEQMKIEHVELDPLFLDKNLEKINEFYRLVFNFGNNTTLRFTFQNPFIMA